VAARVVTLPEVVAEAAVPEAAALGTAMRVSPSTRAAVSATARTRFRMHLLLWIVGSNRDTGTTTGEPVRFPC
jgi:hypothetical protein